MMFTMVYPLDAKALEDKPKFENGLTLPRTSENEIATIFRRYLRVGKYLTLVPFDVKPDENGFRCIPVSGLLKVSVYIFKKLSVSMIS